MILFIIFEGTVWAIEQSLQPWQHKITNKSLDASTTPPPPPPHPPDQTFLLREVIKNDLYTVRLTVRGGEVESSPSALTVTKCENDPF